MRQWDNAKSDCTTQVNLFVDSKKRQGNALCDRNKMASLCYGWKLRWRKERAVTWIIDNRNRCWATHLKSASSVSIQLYGHLAKVWLVDMANIFPEGDIIDLLSCVNQSKLWKFYHFSLDFMVQYGYNHISLDSSVMLDANAAFFTKLQFNLCQ